MADSAIREVVGLPIGIYIGIGAVLVVVAIVLVSTRGRGRLIRCPECGATFKRPALPEKRSGVGFTIGGMGNYTCPSCKYSASTNSFAYVDNSTNDGTNKSSNEGKPQ